MGQPVMVELCYKSSAPVIPKVLVVRGLPDIQPTTMRAPFEHILKKKTKAKVEKFAVKESTAYITFSDPSGITCVHCKGTH